MARLGISFLGTFQATLNRQPITHFRSANNQGLLVYLALQSEKPIAREMLTAILWPDETEKNARNNLRQSLFQLRKLLDDNRESEQPFLLVTRQTVQFNQESDFDLDVQHFLQAIDDGDLETAVSHYHGDLLPGFTCDSLEFEHWLRQEREHLHNLALETMSEATQDYLRNGRFDKAQSTARQQLQLEPWHEHAHRQLMRAYVLGGDRGKALQQFVLCQTILHDELDITPAESTIQLHEDIKAGRIAPTASTETIKPPVKTRHNLPTDITPLIGRELELEEVSNRLIQDEQRLVTIVGPGGMGKTRLAIAVGMHLLDQFEDGVYFIDLAPLAQPDEIKQAIATTLNYRSPDTEKALFPQLLQAIRQQNLLLILDNFEHVLDGTHFVNGILQHCPNVSVLTTSRQRLNLSSESRYELGGLTFPDWLTPEDAMTYTAVQLFVENGCRAQAGFALTKENITDVTRICQLVQGMPLGLVLAASWLELLDPAEIAEEINKSIDFLAVELTDLPPRQRSMEAVFDYSWQMLSTIEQTALSKLSVFRGGFTRDAAKSVAGANLRILLSLVNKSLLQRQRENGRFRIHELLRQFAAAKRHKLDPENQTALIHCHYFSDLAAKEVRWALTFYPQHITLKHKGDFENFRRAWDYALTHGMVTELSGMARGMVMIDYTHGLQPARDIADAIQVLEQHGVLETDPVMLHLQLIDLTILRAVGNRNQFKERFSAFLPIVEKYGDSELHLWTYDQVMASAFHWHEQLIAYWAELAENALEKMGNEQISKAFEIYTLWERTTDHPPDAKVQDRLEKLKIHFEPEHANSFLFYFILELLHSQYKGSGAFDQAIEIGSRALNLAKQWHDLYWISYSALALADTYTEMGQNDNARRMRLDDFEWHWSTGQSWQMLGYLWARAHWFTQWIGGEETAVSLISFVFHHPETPLNYRQEIEDIQSEYKEKMGGEVFNKAWEAGKQLNFETAVNLVRAPLESSVDDLSG